MQEGRGLYRWGELDTLSASSSDSSASSWPQPPRPTQQQRVSPANPWDRFLLPGPHQDQPRKGGGDNSSSSWQIWSSGEQEQEWGSSSRAAAVRPVSSLSSWQQQPQQRQTDNSWPCLPDNSIRWEDSLRRASLVSRFFLFLQTVSEILDGKVQELCFRRHVCYGF